MIESYKLDRSGIPEHPHIEHSQRLFPVFDCATQRWLARSESNYLVGWLPPSLPFTREQIERAEMRADWREKSMRVELKFLDLPEPN
jgi:hypothetical protein